MSADKPFTKENLDSCLKELAKEFRKKTVAECLLKSSLLEELPKRKHESLIDNRMLIKDFIICGKSHCSKPEEGV